MAGLGMGVDVRAVARTGLRVTFAVTASLVAYPDFGNKRPVISRAYG
jgi:hypothetical protein